QPAFVEIDKLEPPQVLAVDDREKRPRAFWPDETSARRLSLVVLRRKIGNPKIDRHRQIDMRFAADFDAKQLTHRAGKAVTADEILRTDGFGSAGLLVAQDCRHAAGILNKALELDAMPQRDVRKRPRMVLQDRIEPGLRARHSSFRADGKAGLILERWHAHAPKLVALQIS